MGSSDDRDDETPDSNRDRDALPDTLNDAEQDALHEFQLAIEHVYRGYGALLEFHHEIGGAMGRMDEAESLLREAGHEEWANELRDDHLPAGAIDDRWTYELVDEFSQDFLEDVTAFEAAVREELADGHPHVTERAQQRRWRERADGWSTDQ